jgi:hypothetical protein
MVVRIPFGNGSFRLLYVSDIDTDDKECDRRIQAACPSARQVWITAEWQGLSLPERSLLRCVWVDLSDRDEDELIRLTGELQAFYDPMLRIPGFQPPKKGSKEKGYFGNYRRAELPDDPVWFFDGSEVRDDQVKPSVIASKPDLTGCMVQHEGTWIPALDYPPVSTRIVRKPAPPMAPAKPEAPAKPAKPAKPGNPQTSLVDVTQEVAGKVAGK